MKMKLTNHIPEVQQQINVASERALTRIAIDVDRTAKENCPVDTGRLRASISYSVDGKAGAGFEIKETSEEIDHQIKSGEGSAIVGTNVVYAKAIEYGHSKKAPSGYLRNALDQNKGNIKDIIKQEFSDVGK